MLRILAIAAVLTAVCGTKYAYVGNNLIEYEDTPTQSISLPYPYQEPKITKDSEYINEENSIQNAVETSSEFEEDSEDSLFSIGLVCSKITKIFNFIKRKIVKIITAVPSFIINIIVSISKCIISSLCKHFDIARIPSMSDLSAMMTPDRLKRATEYLDKALKQMNSL